MYRSYICLCISNVCRGEESDRSLIERHDSSLSAMRCLLGSESSQECSTPGDETASTPAESQECSTPGDETASTPAVTSDHTVPPTPESTSDHAVPPTPTETVTPSPPTTELPPTPQPTGTATPPQDQDKDFDRVPHQIHAGAVISNENNIRTSLRTRRPRLWRHQHEIHESMCRYAGMFTY